MAINATKRVEAAGTTTVLTDEEFKQVLYEAIVKLSKSTSGYPLSKPKARRVFTRLTELIFWRVVETGYFRFPGGYGTLKLTKLKDDANVRVMPSGARVKPKDVRYKIRYKDGVTVMTMLGTNPHKYRRKTPRKSSSEDQAPATV